MKLVITLVIALLLALTSRSQSVLTLKECIERAEANYPLTMRRGLLEKVRTFSLENASKGSLPSVNLGGHATYQSDVTRIPVEMPGVEPLSKDQYRVFAEVSQTLYHGFLVAQQRNRTEAGAQVEERELEVELYGMRDRIIDVFFGIMLLQEQMVQTRLVRKDLNSMLVRIEASISNGTAIRSEADALKAELLRVDQRIIEMEAGADLYKKVLAHFIGEPVAEDATLQKPQFPIVPATMRRPELDLFDSRAKSLESELGLLTAGKKPRLELFVQGGYGRPGLNMLRNAFDTYYLGGLRLNWRLSGYYTLRREKEILSLRMQSLDIQKETFLFNTGLELEKHEAEISKFRRLLEVDDEIINLRTGVRRTAEVQLQEGVITSSDFVREVNAEDQARQNRAIHEVQLLMAGAKYQFTLGQ
jgi:outer membrane protein TolC